MIRSSTTNWSVNSPSSNPPTAGNQHASQLVDPRQLDANLLELALIGQRSALFYRFLHERANEEMEIIGTDESTQDVIMHGKDKRFYGGNGLLASSGLTKRTRELMNSYLVIDNYLLKRNIEKVNITTG